jgi:hypothetical protein
VLALSEQTFFRVTAKPRVTAKTQRTFDKSPGTVFSLLPAPQQRMSFVDWDMVRSIAGG